MTRLPRLKGKEVIRILERAGFRLVRTQGSHAFLMGVRQSCRHIQAKRLALVLCGT